VESVPDLTVTARRVGDLESRTEEYDVALRVAEGPPETLHVKYLASRAYEINAGLDACVEAARKAIASTGLNARPTDEAISKLSWRTIQGAKYGGGEPNTGTLPL
jgi:hypothetical protein